MFRTAIMSLAITTALSVGAWAKTIEVQMLNKGEDGENMVFEPSHVRLEPGDSIKFIATDKSHNAESIEGSIPEGAESFKSKINEELEVTFDEEGYYAVKCLPHFAMGMVMTVAVGEGTEPQEGFLEGRIPPKAQERFDAQIEALASDDAEDIEATEEATEAEAQ